MIVTIDGPAGAGKSTAARELAKRLGFRFLDTGALYRAVALAVLEADIPWQQSQQVAQLAESLEIRLQDNRIWLADREVTADIRTPRVTQSTRHTADNLLVRENLNQRQRAMAQQGDTVTEGRDQGTIVFPDAECKIFLTATPEERAKRRLAEVSKRGEPTTYDEILAQQNQRDAEDTQRAVAPLRKAEDAIEIITDGLGLDEVVSRMESAVRQSCQLR